MNKKIWLSLAAALALTACGNKQNDNNVKDNPLLQKSELPYGAPDFAAIAADDFMPAFEAGMKQQKEQIDSITQNADPATFENTILALERSGELLRRTSNVFFALTNANSNDTLLEIEGEVTPLLAEHGNYISLNDALFQRIKTVYEKEYETKEGEDKKLLKEVYDEFVRNGAALSAEQKKELEAVNTQLATLQQQFDERVTKGTNAAGVWVENKEDLSGLSDEQLKQCQADAEANGSKAPYYLLISNTTQQDLLASLDNRELRKKVFEASVNRCADGQAQATSDLVLQIVRLRAEKAKLLGYDTFADWRLQNTMAKKSENVYSFFQNLISPYLVKVAGETAEIQAFARQSEGADFELQPYDRFYYSGKMKKAKFNFDDAEVKPYFELDSVLKNGVFYAANKVYGISFEERKDLPVYQDDVRVFNVKDKDGSIIALFYADYYRRESKRGGAWMDSFAKQSDYFGQIPVIYNVCNFARPADGEPALLTMDNVETMFHEFGHALHGIFSKCRYNTLSGTAVSRDFVEYPSQFNEYFATVPAVFDNYAKHYETQEPMPAELKKKMQAASHYHAAYALGENMAASLVDMAWHTINEEQARSITDAESFQTEALKKMNLLDPQVPPRYLTTYFRHVFGGGYAAGYYSYLWSEVLAVNTANIFEAHGGLDAETGAKLREDILSVGNTKDLSEQFTLFSGLEEPNAKELIKAKGL